MLTVVTDRRLIARYERLLTQNLREKFREEYVVDIWTPGGTERRAKILWSAKLGAWTYWTKYPDRYWNPFGISSPSEVRKVSPNLEVNFPLHGIDRSFAGVFLADKEGRIGIGHRGRIGGGRKGIGKSLFMRKYPEPFEEIQDGEKPGKVAFIGLLGSNDLPDRLVWLMKEVIKMKDDTESRVTALSPKLFVPEFEGARKDYSISSPIQATVDHGRIVNELKRQVEALGYAANRDQARDLFVINRGRVELVFEVKPDFGSTYVYSAIGQLKYNALEMRSAKQVAVLPLTTPKHILRRLRRLAIESITFTMTGKGVVFDDLDRRLKSILKR